MEDVAPAARTAIESLTAPIRRSAALEQRAPQIEQWGRDVEDTLGRQISALDKLIELQRNTPPPRPPLTSEDFIRPEDYAEYQQYKAAKAQANPQTIAEHDEFERQWDERERGLSKGQARRKNGQN
jgi:uncharacterized short protein YbdD (DUF466 family)